MKINFLGDSITEGACASKPENTYHAVVGQILNAEVKDYGKGGTRFAEQNDKQVEWDYLSFNTRAKYMDKDADIVMVFGGTNDYGHGDADFGNIDNEDPNTFCGAIHELCKYLLKTWKPYQINFIIPLPRYNENLPCPEGKRKDNPPLETYRQAIRDIVMSYQIMTLDVRDVFKKPSTNQPSEYYQDGLHPNDKGHALLGEKVAKYIEDRYINKTSYKVINF